MRKITLMLTLLAFSLLTFAQMPHFEKVKANADSYVNNYKSVKSVKASGDVFYEEHFDATRWAASVNDENLAITANMPDGWTVVDVTNNKFFWHWSLQGPRGKYASGGLDPDETVILSTTGTDGFMMLESDFFNTDASGDAVSEPIEMESYLQSPAIDLSNAPGVTLKFQQYYRYCCGTTDKLVVFVSNDYNSASPDDAHWAEYNTMSAGVNVTSDNADMVEVDITDAAAEQASVYIRWGQIGASAYHWEIDDVVLVEPMTNNILIEQTWADYLKPQMADGDDPTTDWYGGYTSIPLDVVGEYVGFRAAVKNFGLATQTGVLLNTVITKDDETVVYDEKSSPVDVEKSQRDTLTTVGFTPTQKGHYQVSYTVSQNEEDDFMTDNYDDIYFNITDSVFSRTSATPAGHFRSVSTGGWVGGGNDGDALANLYEIPESAGQVVVSSLTTYFSTYNDTALIADGNMSMKARLYGVDDAGDVSETPIISSEMYYLTLNDTGKFITLQFVKDGSEYIQPGEYYAAIETYSTDADNPLYIAEDKTVPHPNGNCCIVYLGDHWGAVTANFVINLNITPTTPVPADVTFNVNMKYQITKGDFVTTSDKINVLVNDNAAVEMTDADGDSIYTYVLSGYNIGNELEYEYGINDGLETLDAKRTHKISATPADNILTAWYSDDEGNGNGIENLNNLNKISIYPNPVSSELHINNVNNVNRIVISNVLGQEVRTINNPANDVTINASDFNKGMYIVTIIDNNNNSKSTRFIKQ